MSYTILKLPQGGYVVIDGPAQYEGNYRSYLYGSLSIEDALNFVRLKLNEET